MRSPSNQEYGTIEDADTLLGHLSFGKYKNTEISWINIYMVRSRKVKNI